MAQNFKTVKEKFNELSPRKKEELLKEIYDFSKDTRLFLENKFLGGYDNIFIEQMEKETIGKIYKAGIPGDIEGKKVNEIIQKAKKSGVSVWTITKLEQLAYRGFIEFLNEFGGGPENFEDMACRHLENYLKLVLETIENKDEQNNIFNEVKNYLLKKDNMCVDFLYEVFYETTGIPIGR